MGKVYNQQTCANPHLLSVKRRAQIGGQGQASWTGVGGGREEVGGRHGHGWPPTSVVPDSEVGIRAQRTLKGDTATVTSFISVQGPDNLNQLGGRRQALYGVGS